MAKDVALRQLDQAGFRISNLGTPTEAGDATKTDNQAVPKANAGAGSPGTSFLAAPADHVHPATSTGGGAGVEVDDPTYQTVTGTTEELISELFVDLNGIPAAELEVAFSAIVKASAGNVTFRVRLGGTPGLPDGTSVAAISTPSNAFIAEDATTEHVPNPGHHQLLKITAVADSPAGVAHIYGKTVQLRAQPGA